MLGKTIRSPEFHLHSKENQINNRLAAACVVLVFRTPFIKDDDQKHKDTCYIENEESFVDSCGHSGPVTRPASIFLALKEQMQVLLQISQLIQDHLESVRFPFEIIVLKHRLD